jgi:hypothetical protein
MRDSLSRIKNADIRIDLDQLQLNKQTEFRIHELETEIDLSFTGNEMDLMDSQLLNGPVSKIKKALEAYEFIPIKRQQLTDL